MKNLKSFLAKNFLILAFAVGGVFVVTSNVTVSANETVVTEIDTGEVCASTTRCNPAMGDYTSEFSGKKYCCNWQATSRGWADKKGIN